MDEQLLYYVFGTLRNFSPNVCEALWQKCFKYTKDALEHFCHKPKQTAKIFRAENIIQQLFISTRKFTTLMFKNKCLNY